MFCLRFGRCLTHFFNKIIHDNMQPDLPQLLLKPIKSICFGALRLPTFYPKSTFGTLLDEDYFVYHIRHRLYLQSKLTGMKYLKRYSTLLLEFYPCLFLTETRELRTITREGEMVLPHRLPIEKPQIDKTQCERAIQKGIGENNTSHKGE